jgi:hypothetical protein
MTEQEKREILRQARENIARHGAPREDILERRIREIEERREPEEPLHYRKTDSIRARRLQAQRNAATKPAPERSENTFDTVPHFDPVRLQRDWQQPEVDLEPTPKTEIIYTEPISRSASIAEPEPEFATKEQVMEVLKASDQLCQALERQQRQIDDLERAIAILKEQSVAELSGEIKRMLDGFSQEFGRKLDAIDDLLTRSNNRRPIDLPNPLLRRVN